MFSANQSISLLDGKRSFVPLKELLHADSIAGSQKAPEDWRSPKAGASLTLDGSPLGHRITT